MTDPQTADRTTDQTANRTADIQDKSKRLREYIQAQGSLAVAFSGGVDSTYLLKVAHDVLGDKALAVTASASAFSHRDLEEAAAFCQKEGIRHVVVEVDELAIPGFQENPPDRCYRCKKEIFGKLRTAAAEYGITAIAEGSNMSDLGDYRPGLQAIAELGVLSPLRAAGLYKDEIRILSKQLNLPTWTKPSAACLASRFVYGERITRDKLHMVEQGENLLQDMGFHQLRVRMHGDTLARIEVDESELQRALQERERITEEFQKIGFRYVTLDLRGYRMGSMNEVLTVGVGKEATSNL